MKGNPLTTLAETVGARRVATSYERNTTYDTDGKPISEAGGARLETLRKRFHRALEQAQEGERDVSVRQVAERVARESGGSTETKRLLNFLVSAEAEQEYAGSAAALSAHGYDSARSFPGGDALFPDGFHALTKRLASGLPLKLGHVVREIDWSGASVRVVTNRGEFSAEQVLVTLPLGVLKAGKMRFAPTLPAAKRRAIAGLGMGVLNKCFLRFPRAFWPRDIDWLEYIPKRHGEWTEWVSFQRVLGKPVLLGFHAADRAQAIESWTDQQVVASAMETLRTIYGKGIPEPVGFQITRWASDPFAFGSYSFQPVGSTPELRKELARPLDGKLFFAGEATEQDYFGTAHGAYLSGLRAARELS